MSENVSAPNTWFRVKHPEGFSPEVFKYFRAACRIFRARIESLLANWDDLALTEGTTRPTVEFSEPELSEDRSIASLPLCAEKVTLGSRALLQEAAKDLYALLPVPFMLKVEVGITEPPIEGGEWRNDWWNPHKATPAPPEEILDAIRRRGARIVSGTDPAAELKSKQG